MSAEVAPVARTAARVLLVNDEDRILLFRGFDPQLPDRLFWFTPGGAVETGESLEEAALRELREETGCTEVILSGPVCTRRMDFSFDGTLFDSEEIFFFARIPAHEVDTSGFIEVERRTITLHHWWSVAELAATDEVIYPAELGAVLGDLLRDGLPAVPVVLQG